MSITTSHSTAQQGHSAGAIQAHSIPIRGVLAPYVNALMAFEMDATGPMPLAIVPHESLVLSVQIGRGRDCIERKGAHGELTRLTGIRQWTGRFTGAGDCITLLALLTPLGAVQLLESQPLAVQPRIHARVDGLLERRLTCRLESDIARAITLGDKLTCLAAWLEQRSAAQRQVSTAALRAGRAAMRMCAEPAVSMETLAGEQHVSRRQLERDFHCFIGTSPRHLARVVRLQAVSRRAQAGASLADIAAEVGFADQAHMSRAVRQLTGLSPLRFVRAGQTPMGSAFRRATAGGTVYL
ncbi:MAG: helix-turn-helix domain-containing protein [Burkholderiaceae bacterium]